MVVDAADRSFFMALYMAAKRLGVNALRLASRQLQAGFLRGEYRSWVKNVVFGTIDLRAAWAGITEILINAIGGARGVGKPF